MPQKLVLYKKINKIIEKAYTTIYTSIHNINLKD
jgi:hypothetical protein